MSKLFQVSFWLVPLLLVGIQILKELRTTYFYNEQLRIAISLFVAIIMFASVIAVFLVYLKEYKEV